MDYLRIAVLRGVVPDVPIKVIAEQGLKMGGAVNVVMQGAEPVIALMQQVREAHLMIEDARNHPPRRAAISGVIVINSEVVAEDGARVGAVM